MIFTTYLTQEYVKNKDIHPLEKHQLVLLKFKNSNIISPQQNLLSFFLKIMNIQFTQKNYPQNIIFTGKLPQLYIKGTYFQQTDFVDLSCKIAFGDQVNQHCFEINFINKISQLSDLILYYIWGDKNYTPSKQRDPYWMMISPIKKLRNYFYGIQTLNYLNSKRIGQNCLIKAIEIFEFIHKCYNQRLINTPFLEIAVYCYFKAIFQNIKGSEMEKLLKQNYKILTVWYYTQLIKKSETIVLGKQLNNKLKVVMCKKKQQEQKEKQKGISSAQIASSGIFFSILICTYLVFRQ